MRRQAGCADPAVLEQQTRRHAGRRPGARAGRQPRRTVAAAAAARRRRARHEGVRRQPALRVSPRDRAALRDDRPRGPQHPRSRSTPTTPSWTSGSRATTAFPNIRGSRFRRVTLDEGARRRTARTRQPADRDVGRQPHVAGQARQVDPREPARRAGAAAAAGRRNQSGGDPPRRARRRRRCASGWSSTARTRAARPVTR